MQPQINLPAQELIKTTEPMLGEALRGSVLLDTGEILQDGLRSFTYRFCLLEKPDHAPTSVIVKHYTYDWLVPTFYQTANLLGIPLEPGVASELATLKEALLHPDPFLAFIQSDSCPDNCLFRDSTLRLLDFEGGTFDHALKEGVYGRMHFPTCRYVYRMPEHIPLRMEMAYRTELARGCPAAKDEKLFSFAVAEACVFWMIRWYQMDPLLNSLEKDAFFVAATSRQRHLLRSQIVAQTTREAGHMEAIGATIGAMAAKMHMLWPAAADIPTYPAFH